MNTENVDFKPDPTNSCAHNIRTFLFPTTTKDYYCNRFKIG